MGTEMSEKKIILTRWKSVMVLNILCFPKFQAFFNENYNYIIFHLLARNVHVNHIPF